MCAQYGTLRRREKKFSGPLTEFQKHQGLQREGRQFLDCRCCVHAARPTAELRREDVPTGTAWQLGQ